MFLAGIVLCVDLDLQAAALLRVGSATLCCDGVHLVPGGRSWPWNPVRSGDVWRARGVDPCLASRWGNRQPYARPRCGRLATTPTSSWCSASYPASRVDLARVRSATSGCDNDLGMVDDPGARGPTAGYSLLECYSGARVVRPGKTRSGTHVHATTSRPALPLAGLVARVVICHRRSSSSEWLALCPRPVAW